MWSLDANDLLHPCLQITVRLLLSLTISRMYFGGSTPLRPLVRITLFGETKNLIPSLIAACMSTVMSASEV